MNADAISPRVKGVGYECKMLNAELLIATSPNRLKHGEKQQRVHLPFAVGLCFLATADGVTNVIWVKVHKQVPTPCVFQSSVVHEVVVLTVEVVTCKVGLSRLSYQLFVTHCVGLKLFPLHGFVLW